MGVAIAVWPKDCDEVNSKPAGLNPSTALGDLGWLSRVNSPLLRYLGWATFGVMTAAAVGMVLTS
jgi:hypothetical protein